MAYTYCFNISATWPLSTLIIPLQNEHRLSEVYSSGIGILPPVDLSFTSSSSDTSSEDISTPTYSSITSDSEYSYSALESQPEADEALESQPETDEHLCAEDKEGMLVLMYLCNNMYNN